MNLEEKKRKKVWQINMMLFTSFTLRSPRGALEFCAFKAVIFTHFPSCRGRFSDISHRETSKLLAIDVTQTQCILDKVLLYIQMKNN